MSFKTVIFLITVYTALIIIVPSCTPDMEMRSEITKFRILGVKSEPAQITADTPVTLTSLFAVPTGKDAPPEKLDATAAWITMDPDMTGGSLESPGYIIKIADVDTTGESSFGGKEFQFSQKFIDTMTALAGSRDISVPVYILGCNNGKIDIDELKTVISGITATTDLSALQNTCKGKDAEAVTSFKNLDLFIPGEHTDINDTINSNPAIDMLKAGNTVCEGDDGCREPVDFKVSLTPQSFEYYLDYQGKLRNEMENMYLNWYGDGGNFSVDRVRSEDSVTALDAADSGHIDNDGSYILDIESESHWFNVSWKPPVEGGEFHLWIVAHDLRGGTGWKQFTIKAVAPDY